MEAHKRLLENFFQPLWMPLFGLLWDGFMGFTDLNLSIRMGQLEPAYKFSFFSF
jgi:hypothetical protein